MKGAIKGDCGLSPGPIGFLRKSSRSLPAQKESPAPCQSTTRTLSSFAALLRRSALVMYIADVIAFFLDGRLHCTRRMLPERSVTLSDIVLLRPSIPNARHPRRHREHAGLRCRHL